MLEIIPILIIVAIVVFLVIVARQPADFRITRTGVVSAPASAIFPHVNTLQKWDAWSPWAKLDPAATHSFDGPEAGIGAKMSWAGNNKVGVGSMTITNSRPDEYIQFRLDFQKPFKATNTSEFIFTSKDDQTTVTWSMTGTNNLMGKAMGLIMNCDKMVGGQFEQGLASLKTLVEEVA
ncbi:MAG: SRPBCC family protein [Methylovulum sp.]|uniref:SRPBCC family protein n=1 Tax=Methylovulum sp. TaxID=1916980 RepID=UPI00262110A6|nr:SRPBCC family protein [Methylovulum sp.]MDD2725542.1 SRPBCC family protein [Methylovulum sp.]MDD5125817.1 SRPBCC family protein [Methylovulum sp.]